MISGYLFFVNINGTKAEFISKYKKRFETLVLPYLFWSIFSLLIYFLLQSLPYSELFFTKKLIKYYTFNELVYTILYHPIAYQLWFIRDLVVLVILSPIIYWSLKWLKYFVVILLLILWFLKFQFIIFSNEALLFFVLGSYLSIIKYNLSTLINKKFMTLICSILWFSLIIIQNMLLYNNFQNDITMVFLNKFTILIGILAIWLLYDFILDGLDITSTKYYWILSFSFFLFAFHEPTLTFVNKVIFYIIGKGEFASLLTYFVSPILTIFICIYIAKKLKKSVPNFYSIITGGR